MTLLEVLAPATAAGAGALAFAARSVPGRSPDAAPGRHDGQAPLRRLRLPLAALAFLGAWIFLGGHVGALGGAVCAGAAWRILGKTESPAARRRRAELERDLPPAVHLIGACLAAGAPIGGSLETVAAAFPGAVAEELLVVRRRLTLGMDPSTVWRELAEHPQLGPLGRSLARAHRSGASVAAAVEALVGELDAQARSRSDALARTVEVRAAAPLGVCFLPAFVLLGVVPMVVGVFSGMRLFG